MKDVSLLVKNLRIVVELYNIKNNELMIIIKNIIVKDTDFLDLKICFKFTLSNLKELSSSDFGIKPLFLPILRNLSFL